MTIAFSPVMSSRPLTTIHWALPNLPHPLAVISTRAPAQGATTQEPDTVPTSPEQGGVY